MFDVEAIGIIKTVCLVLENNGIEKQFQADSELLIGLTTFSDKFPIVQIALRNKNTEEELSVLLSQLAEGPFQLEWLQSIDVPPK